MKLVSDYRVRFEYFMVVYLLPLALYYNVFKAHIKGLMAGGIMFVYFTMILAFANRYISAFCLYLVADKMGKSPRLYWKTLNPRVVPQAILSDREVRRLELMPIFMVMGLTGVCLGIAYKINPQAYMTKLCLGTLILTTMIFWRQWKYLLKTFEYKGHYFQYNKRTVKIYDNQESYSRNPL